MNILQVPNPILRRKAKPVLQLTDKLCDIISEMFDLMYTNKGVGLAAPQVGISQRFFITHLPGEHEQIFINPEIYGRSGRVCSEEGCLSIPGIVATVNRSEKIWFRARLMEGIGIELPAMSGLLAQVIQHEIEHLDGILFVDHLSPTELKKLLR